MDRTKLGLGVVLMVASGAGIFLAGEFEATMRTVLAAGAALGLAVGTLLVGTSAGGRPV
ncbi:MAG: hypothetical protein ABEJ35_00600 [Halobacteriaceae archaeon]